MKNFLLLSAIISLVFAASFASAAPAASMSATSASVTMTAIVPEYIGLTAVNVSPVLFDFTGYENHLANGETNVGAASRTVPTWTLSYNLKHRTVTVCAYASDLMGTSPSEAGAMIPAAFIGARSVQGGSPWTWFGAVSTCTDQPGHAIMLDQIKGATSSANNGGLRSEGFFDLSLGANPGNGDHGSKGLVPAPDTYTGTLFIVAQAI